MLAWWKWLMPLAALVISQISVNVAVAEDFYSDGFQFTGDLRQSDQVLAYLKSAPKKRKGEAESLFQHAQKHAQRKKVSWGSVSKSSFESLLAYPMGKTFLLGTEARLRQLNEAASDDPQFSRRVLENAVGWLDSAIVSENYAPSLKDAQRNGLVSYRDCLKRYLDSGRGEPTCVPLQWAGIAR